MLLADAGGGALGGEQVGREDADDAGFFCSAASVTCAAMDALSWSNCVPTYLNLGSALAAASKPAWRWSVVLTPGLTLTTSTSPPPGTSCWIALKA